MAKSLSLTHVSLILFRPKLIPSSSLTRTLSLKKKIPFSLSPLPPSSLSFSTTSTPFPLQYDMIINRPTHSQPHHRTPRVTKPISDNFPQSDPPQKPGSESGFDGWLDKKLLSETETDRSSLENLEMDKSKRKYYNKRRKRMYGSDSDEDDKRYEERLVELKPEVVELNTLHKREEELFFYDAFAYPWEKEKHYKMVYQLEKKYFPEHCLDKAFLEPGESNASVDSVKGMVKVKVKKKADGKKYEGVDDKGLVFFEEEGEEKGGSEMAKEASKDVTEKKVEEFFKCLKKVPNKDGEIGNGEPYLVTRSTELPPRWDGPCGTVVLVNKPKGESRASLCHWI